MILSVFRVLAEGREGPGAPSFTRQVLLQENYV